MKLKKLLDSLNLTSSSEVSTLTRHNFSLCKMDFKLQQKCISTELVVMTVLSAAVVVVGVAAAAVVVLVAAVMGVN